MRGEKILKILAILEDMIVSQWELFDVLTTTQPLGIHKVQREMMRRRGRRTLFFEELAEYLKEREKFSKLIYKLKAEGLIYESKNSKLQLTSKGKSKLQKLKEKILGQKEVDNEATESSEHSNESQAELLIAIYDIPEYERLKRDRLRKTLEYFGFKFLQRSVWIKEGKVSERFIDLMKEIDVLDYLHLFKITKKGTIEQVK